MSNRDRQLDTSNLKMYSAKDRINLVTVEGLMTPGVAPHEVYSADGFDELVERILIARKNERPVIWSFGAHVIKNNLSRYIIELIKIGVITHIASNGAGSIVQHGWVMIATGSQAIFQDKGSYTILVQKPGIARSFMVSQSPVSAAGANHNRGTGRLSFRFINCKSGDVFFFRTLSSGSVALP